MIEQMRTQIDKSLETFLGKVQKKYKMDLVDPILFESIQDFVLRKGKRIRPMLLILAYNGYSQKTTKTSPSIYDISACVELLHNFMLIHDDIIDRSNLRRGKPTMHKVLEKAAKTKEKEKLGSDLSIIVGDIVYALAIESFLAVNEEPERKTAALQYFVQTAVYTAMGEFIDTLHGVKKVQAIAEKDVLLNYTLKTAHYTFSSPMVVGALLAGADKTNIRNLSETGILIGQAFQIQDDILGIFDSQKNIGKSILSDISESKKTMLVIHAYNHLKAPGKRLFMKCFNKEKNSYQDLVTIRKIFIQAGSLDYCLDEIKKRLTRAHKILHKLEMKTKYHNQLKESLLHPFKHSCRIAQENKIKWDTHCQQD